MIREEFPLSGSGYMGGSSDGWEYRTGFAGSNLQASYDMITSFLNEEGYQDVPVPKNAADLLYFKIPNVRKQILLFGDNGYVHNPIKILFDAREAKPRTLFLHIYNENIKNHLLRFHGKIVEERVVDEKKRELLGFSSGEN
jgi:hypothetical protein